MRNPDFANAYNNLGQAHEAAGNLAAALRQYQMAVERDPDLGGAWFNLGTTSESLGQPQRALGAFRRARDLLEGVAEHQIYADRAQQAIIRLESAVGDN